MSQPSGVEGFLLYQLKIKRLLVSLPVKRFLGFEKNLPAPFLLLPLVELITLSSSEDEPDSIMGPV